MKFIACMLIGAGLLVTGCTSPMVGEEPEPFVQSVNTENKAYAVDVLFIEGTKEQLEAVGLMSGPVSVSTAEISSAIDRIEAADVSKLTPFPAIYLDVSDKGVYDGQKPVEYTTEFDAKGQPTAHETLGDGKKVQAHLISVSSETAEVSVKVEDRELQDWMTYEINGNKIRQPIFSAKAASFSLMLTMNQWATMGGIQGLDPSFQMITAVRIRQEDLK